MKLFKISAPIAIASILLLQPNLVRAEIIFNNTKFDLISVAKVDGTSDRIAQKYQAVGENKNQCRLYVDQRPKASVKDILNLDMMVMRPPIAIAAIEIARNPSTNRKEDAMSIILMRDRKDESAFKVILHRATLLDEEMVREMQIECTLKYAGVFSKNTSEFDKVKSTWVANAFSLEPELVAPQ